MCQTNKPKKGHDCMHRLPDLLVLDFCEWIKCTILSKAQYTNIDMWDLLFDEKYDKLLIKKRKNIVIGKENRKITTQGTV